jgi:hypothetical protein
VYFRNSSGWGPNQERRKRGLTQLYNSVRERAGVFYTSLECILNLLHPKRVYFASFSLVSSVLFEACPAKMTVRIKKGRVRRNKKGQFTSLFHLLHSFRVNFSTSPLVSSVFFIFSTRFECGFSVNQKSNWFQTKIWFQCLLRTLKVKFSIHSSLQIRL